MPALARKLRIKLLSSQANQRRILRRNREQEEKHKRTDPNDIGGVKPKVYYRIDLKNEYRKPPPAGKRYRPPPKDRIIPGLERKEMVASEPPPEPLLPSALPQAIADLRSKVR